ncbi:MAG: hypothetical protein ABIO19_07590 [Burkholderiaceae bacterium]
MSAPLWLESPEMQQLLRKLVDSLDWLTPDRQVWDLPLRYSH